MANTKISQLIENTNPTWFEELVYAYNNNNGKMSLETMKTFVQPDLSSYATISQLQLKQDKLVSWVSVKTVNWNSILWSGNIDTTVNYSEYDYSAMQWPAPAWFHVPLNTEWQWLKTIMDWLTFAETWWDIWRVNLHMPFAWYRNLSATAWYQGSIGIYWSSYSNSNSQASRLIINSSNSSISDYSRWNWLSIRCFRDEFVVPTSSWSVINWTLWGAWIFWDSNSWLISITADWTTWYTIQDKNLWATQVYSDWDTLSAANCWYYFQWWNNYWFAWTWGVTTSNTQVDVSSYWPWNYYSSSTYITQAAWWYPTNNNLWWWETWVVITQYDIYNKLQLVWTDITIWWKFIWWIASNNLSWSYTLSTLSNSYVWHEHYLYIPAQTNNYSLTLWTWITNPFNLTLPSSTNKACLVKFYCDSQSTMIISDCKIAS